MNKPQTCPSCQAELSLGESVCVRCGQPNKSKLNWWLDVVLLVAAPIISFMAAIFSNATQDQMAFVVLGLPGPLAAIAGARLAMRIKGHIALKVILGVVFAAVLYVALSIAGMFGCAWGGGPFNIH